MSKAFRDIAKHSVIFGIGQVLTRLASFLLLPLYTRFLTPADYGVIAILDLVVGVLGILVGSGMATAAIRHHFDTKDERDRDRVWWTALTFVAGTTTLLVLPMYLFRGPISSFTLGAEETAGPSYFLLVLPTLWLSVVGALPERYLRVQKQSISLVSIALGRLLLNIFLNVLFLVGMKMGVRGILLGNLIAGVAGTAVLLVFLVRSRGPYVFHRPLLKPLWTYGYPLVIIALLSTVMHQADRYLLRLFLDTTEVGIYALGYKIAEAINQLCLVPFTAIWTVVIYEIAELPDADRVYGRVFSLYAYGLMLVILGVSLFAAPVIAIMAAPEYAAAASIVPVVSLAYLFFSLPPHFNVPARLSKNTAILLPSSYWAAGTNLAANFLMIPRMGAAGAAWASVITFAVYAFVTLVYCRRIRVIHYPFARIAGVLVLLLADFGVYVLVARSGLEGLRLHVIAACLWALPAVLMFRPVLYPALRYVPGFPGGRPVIAPTPRAGAAR